MRPPAVSSWTGGITEGMSSVFARRPSLAIWSNVTALAPGPFSPSS